MIRKISFFFLLFILHSCQQNVYQLISSGDRHPIRPQTPVMGWSSWNHFQLDISEELIKQQADSMGSTGLLAAGYSYINIEDGYFGGRDSLGNLYPDKDKFPNGMKSLSDYIHSKGLKAGIYTDAGYNTCGSIRNNDPIGIGVGLFDHDEKDLNLLLNEWNYDFIKVDWCGGAALELDDKMRYSDISKIIRKIRPDVVFNVCRGQFPGKWAPEIADSWRISGDAETNFESIMHIVDLNADLWKYSSRGKVNDMGTLLVGQGMSYEEDKTHFSMWCMMNSPLLAGNDLRNMSEETISILTNNEMIAIDQDPLVYQARRLIDMGMLEVWAKPLISTLNGQVAVALLNRSDEEATLCFSLNTIGIDASQGFKMRDVWNKTNFRISYDEAVSFAVPAHGIVVIKVKGKMKQYNVFHTEN